MLNVRCETWTSFIFELSKLDGVIRRNKERWRNNLLLQIRIFPILSFAQSEISKYQMPNPNLAKSCNNDEWWWIYVCFLIVVKYLCISMQFINPRWNISEWVLVTYHERGWSIEQQQSKRVWRDCSCTHFSVVFYSDLILHLNSCFFLWFWQNV